MKFKCIIFDCDGVLVDSEPISNKVIVGLANKLGVDISLEYALKNYAGTSYNYIRLDLRKKLNKELPLDFEEQYRSTSFKAFKKELKPIKGIEQVLKNIDIPKCVASNGPLFKIKHNLQVTNLLSYFSGNLFSAYDCNSWKPSPKLFLHAAKTMGFAPKDCAIIEDSLSGIRAARAGDFKVFAIANNKEKENFKKEGAVVFNKMNDLLPLLR